MSFQISRRQRIKLRQERDSDRMGQTSCDAKGLIEGDTDTDEPANEDKWYFPTKVVEKPFKEAEKAYDEGYDEAIPEQKKAYANAA